MGILSLYDLLDHVRQVYLASWVSSSQAWGEAGHSPDRPFSAISSFANSALPRSSPLACRVQGSNTYDDGILSRLSGWMKYSSAAVPMFASGLSCIVDAIDAPRRRYGWLGGPEGGFSQSLIV